MHKKLFYSILSLSIFTFMASLDSSIVNVAIPTMSKELSVSAVKIEWVISIYLMTISSFILFFGRLGDMIGKVKIFKLGTIIFTIGSLLAGINYGFIFLLFGRFIQAFGASMTMASNFGITTSLFPANKRGRALSILGTFFALGSVAGPSLGGLILGIFSWNYIFWINIPIGIVAFIMGEFGLPKKSVYTSKIKIDWNGTFLFILFIWLFFGSLMEGQSIGFNNIFILITFFISLLIFIIFIFIEKKTVNPMLNLMIFKNSNFTLGVTAALLVFTIGFFFSVLIPYYLINAHHYSTTFAGLLIMAIPITLAIVGPIGGYLSDKFGGTKITILGLAILILAQLLVALFFTTQSSPLTYILIAIIYGIGMGIRHLIIQ